jgi:hypothetical protein
MGIKIVSHSMALITDVPKDAKNDEYMTRFVIENPTFIGKVTIMKLAGWTEYNGDEGTRHYEYEIERGKYRARRYTGENKWKIVIPDLNM